MTCIVIFYIKFICTKGSIMINGIDYYRKYEPVFKYWTIDRLIGEGASGEVFEISCRAPDGKIHRSAMKAICIPKSDVEFKMLQNDGFTPESAIKYLDEIAKNIENEYSFMARLNGNPNIVMYQDHMAIKHASGIGWDILIKMQLLMPFTEYYERYRMNERDVIKLGIHMCNALGACHDLNVIHRDIKPDNIFADEFGNFKLGDFGIAKIIEKTQSGLTKTGTVTYMAPEMYRGEAYGKTVDIYSLGIVLYKLLNHNRVPFMPAYPEAITFEDKDTALFARMNGTPLPPPDGTKNGALRDIILKACAFKAADRYQSAGEMKAALEKLYEESTDVNVPYAAFTTVVPAINDDIIENAEILAEIDSVNKKSPSVEKAVKKSPSAKSKSRFIWSAAIAFIGTLFFAAVFIWLFSNAKDDKDSKGHIPENDCVHDLTEITEGEWTGENPDRQREDITVCSACGKTVETKTVMLRDVCSHIETEIIEGEKINDKLDWTRVDEITCTECGYVVDTETLTGTDECTHTETEISEGEKDYTSTLEWTRVVETKCTICGITVSSEDVTGKDECTHPTTTTVAGKKNYTGLNWTKTDEIKCTVCEEVLETKTESGKDECAHSSTKVVQGDKQYKPDKINWTRTDSTVCKKCNTTISTKTVSGTDKCTHKNVNRILESEIQVGNNTSKKTYRVECKDCSAFICYEEEFVENECPHLSKDYDANAEPGFVLIRCLDCWEVLERNYVRNN